MRTFWFADLAEILIAFPCGYGNGDELMKVRTLIQTGKIQKKIPILLYGREYWDEIINFEAMLQWNMVSLEDLDLFQFVGSPEEAVSYNSTAHKGWGWVAAYCHAPADAQTSFNNQALSSKRIYVEHVIGKLKVLAIFVSLIETVVSVLDEVSI